MKSGCIIIEAPDVTLIGEDSKEVDRQVDSTPTSLIEWTVSLV